MDEPPSPSETSNTFFKTALDKNRRPWQTKYAQDIKLQSESSFMFSGQK